MAGNNHKYRFVRMFPEILNREAFYNRKHPKLDPRTSEYVEYWRREKKRCIEGWWVEEVPGHWRWMNPDLYYYINHTEIQLVDPDNNSRYYAPPILDDNEWIIMNYITAVFGFSGFTGDTEVTCHELVGKYYDAMDGKTDIYGRKIQFTKADELKLNKTKYVHKPNGDLKGYMEPYEYLKLSHPRDMGHHLYANSPSNGMIFTARSNGKSFSLSSISSRQFNFGGHKYYDNPEFPPGLKEDGSPIIRPGEVMVGASDPSKTSELCNKIEHMLDSLRGEYDGGEILYPAPFFKKRVGTFSVGSTVRASYQKKVKGQWKTIKDGSFIQVVNYGTDLNAGASKRLTLQLVDEVGLIEGADEMHGVSKFSKAGGGTKFGSTVYAGCVCAGTKIIVDGGIEKYIEDVTTDDKILGYCPTTKSLVMQPIESIRPPAKKECVRIYTDKGRVLECSIDHPLYVRDRYESTGVRKFTSSWVDAGFLKAGSLLNVPDSIELWGDKKMFDPRFVGWIISDGFVFKNGVPKLTNADEAIWKIAEGKYGSFATHVDSHTKDGRSLKKRQFVGLQKHFRDLKLAGKSGVNKELPENINQYDRDSICELLAGLYDGDGCVYVHEKTKYCLIKYTTISLKLANDIKGILDKLGIHTNIQKEKPYASTTLDIKGKHPTYNLYIKDNQSLLRFYDNIKLTVPYKQERLERIAEIKKAFRGRDKARNGLRLERVREVVHIGQRDVYNLTAGGSHTYLANGLVTHNTGGDITKIDSSKKLFYNPHIYDIYSIQDVWENKGRIGLFMPGYYSLREYKDENGNTLYEAAIAEIREERERLASSPDPLPLIQEKMFMPLVPSEMFYSVQDNIFTSAFAIERINELEEDNLWEIEASVGKLEFIDRQGSGVVWSEVPGYRKRVINDLMLDKYAEKEGAIAIYEHPEAVELEQRGLYKVAYDPYAIDGKGESYASVLVYKGIPNGTPQGRKLDTIVAEWIGRPMTTDEAHAIAIKMAMYFNTKVLFEDNTPGFKKWCLDNKFGHLLQPEPWEAVNDGHTGKRTRTFKFGVRMTPALKQHCLQLLRTWTLEPRDRDDDGRVTRTNMHELWSLRLLHEIANFGDGNYDHISAMLVMMLWINQDGKMIKEEHTKERVDEFDSFFIGAKNRFYNPLLDN